MTGHVRERERERERERVLDDAEGHSKVARDDAVHAQARELRGDIAEADEEVLELETQTGGCKER
jgi:hypothetical protein